LTMIEGFTAQVSIMLL